MYSECKSRIIIKFVIFKFLHVVENLHVDIAYTELLSYSIVFLDS